MGVELWLLYFFHANPLRDILDIQHTFFKPEHNVDRVGFISVVMWGIDEKFLDLFIGESIA